MVQQKLVSSEKANKDNGINQEELISPEIRFPEFTDYWQITKLDNECKIIMGQSPSSKNYTENPNDTILIQGNADLENGKVKPRIYTTEITKKSEKGDIILTVRAPVGDLAKNEYTVCIGRGVCSIRSEKNNFLYYILENVKRNHTWEKLSQGSTFESINSNDIKNIKFKIPSKNEQNKIANFIYLVDKKIELLEKKIYLIKNLKEFILQNKIKEINRKHDFVKVEEIFSLTRGEVIAKTKIKSYPDESYKYPVYSSQTVNDGVMGYYKDYDFDGEYITWTTDGANAGKTKFRKGKFKCSNVCGVLKAKKGYEFYTNEFMANYLDKNTHKYVSYVGNPKLMNNVMAKIKLPLVEKNTQQTFSKIISAFDLKIELSMQELNQMENFKKGLLQKMFV